MRGMVFAAGLVVVAVLCWVPHPVRGGAVDVLSDQLVTVRDLVGGLIPDLSRGPDETLRWYLLALVTRSAALRNAVVVPTLRAPSVGPSSPWVYRVKVKGEALSASPFVFVLELATERSEVSDVGGRYLITGVETYTA